MAEDFTPYALVADDDVLIRMDASDILQDAGFRVHEAANADEARVILKQAGASIQLLFTDVHMPPSKGTGSIWHVSVPLTGRTSRSWLLQGSLCPNWRICRRVRYS